MTLHLTPAEAAKLVPGQKREPKYRVAPVEVRTYKSICYDSKFEAEFAAQCDLRKAAGELVDWRYHPRPYVLKVNGHILGAYTLDFALVYADGRGELLELKGHWAPVDKWRFKVFLALWEEKLQQQGWTIRVLYQKDWRKQ